jgi:hypothetical protein
VFPVRYKLYILPTQCICVFRMVLTINSASGPCFKVLSRQSGMAEENRERLQLRQSVDQASPEHKSQILSLESS